MNIFVLRNSNELVDDFKGGDGCGSIKERSVCKAG